ncbi:hypothetical protein [Variovorax paradoxus]|uniref:hypothetical protein n=1 Tax=Variovorax paradoxus TaxID=34073 RepID=UPI003D65A266
MDQAELFFPQPMPAPAIDVAPLEACDDDTPFRFEEVEPEPRVAYLVRLADYPHPVADAVKVAEQRFRRELDRQLGHDVVPALRAFQNASESGESDLTKDEIALAKRWIKAFDAARTAGLRDLGDTDEAYFAVRVL